MKRAHCVMVGGCSSLKAHARAFTIGLTLVWVASLASPAWGQWTGGPTGPIYYSGGNVGIGSTTPSAPLTVVSSTGPQIRILSTTASDYSMMSYQGTAHEYRVGVGNASESLFGINNKFFVYDANASAMRLVIDTSGNVGIGTTTPPYRLSVEGTIGAREVVVNTTTWADHVFRPDYRLRPLSEVNAYIQAHHHLPDIPSEAEVKEKGVSVGEMQAKLLAKVEELTLHVIRQERESQALQTHLSEQQRENQELRARLAQLEARAYGGSAPAVAR